MASLFKPTYTTRDPKTGRRVQRKAKKWYGQYTDGAGILRRDPLATDKTAAQQMLNELTRRAEMERAGISDPFRDHRKRPLAEHLTDFESSLRAKGVTEDHVKLVSFRARKLVDGCGFRSIPDISASRAMNFLADLKRAGLSIQTCNFYLQAAKQFCRWLVKDRRTQDNPLAHLSGGNVKLDRRHDRRALSVDELNALLDAARRGETFRGLSGSERALLYTVAAFTGLRASELASLLPSSFDLDAETPRVTVAAAYSKHRRQDVLPLHPQLVGLMRSWLEGKAPDAPLWPGKWAKGKQAGVMLKRDLERAGIAYRDANGLVADFHSLRHTFITNLCRAGVAPKVAQTLARHSTITLTLDRYTHVNLYDQAGALESLPALESARAEKPEPQSLRATGTDDTLMTISCTDLAQTGEAQCDSLTSDEKTVPQGLDSGTAEPNSPKSQPEEALDNDCEGMTTDDNGESQRRRWDSNPRYPCGYTGFRDRPTAAASVKLASDSEKLRVSLAQPLAQEDPGSLQDTPEIDPGLSEVMDRWERLSEPIRAAIVALVRSQPT
jgi:integrase